KLETGPKRPEKVMIQPGIGITDIFRRHGQQDFFDGAVAVATGKHVKQHEKGRLAAIGQRDIALSELPAKLPAQHLHQLTDKLNFPLGRVVDTNQPPEIPVIIKNLLQPPAETL